MTRVKELLVSLPTATMFAMEEPVELIQLARQQPLFWSHKTLEVCAAVGI